MTKNSHNRFEKIIAIIGGGISGVAVAYELNKIILEQNLNYKIHLYEQNNKLGGIIESVELGEYFIENGPEAFITQDNEILKTIRELNLEHDLISMNKNFRRTFILKDDKLNPLPDGFRMFLPSNLTSFFESSLFSGKAKIEIFNDLKFIFNKNTQDISLYEFVTQRFGNELYETVAEPMLSAIYGGSPKELSVNSTLKLFKKFRQKYGSVLLGLLNDSYNQKHESGPRYSLFMTLKNGLSQLIEAMIKNLPSDTIKYNTKVMQINRNNDKYQLDLGNKVSINVDSVVLATSSYISASLLNQIDSELANLLNSISYSSAIVVNLCYNKIDLSNKINGFGYVVPENQNKFIKACSFSSVKFPDKINLETFWLRAFICGKTAENNMSLSNSEIIDKVKQELRQILGIKKEPDYVKAIKYPKSMPQYKVGHEELVNRIEQLARSHNNLLLVGNAYRGVGLGDLIQFSAKNANVLIKQLESAQSDS